jgi:hypothetical protein
MQSGFVRQKRHGQVGTHSDRSNDCAGVRIEASRDIQCNPNGGFRRPVDPFDRLDPLAGKGPRKPDAEEGVDNCDWICGPWESLRVIPQNYVDGVAALPQFIRDDPTVPAVITRSHQDDNLPSGVSGGCEAI